MFGNEEPKIPENGDVPLPFRLLYSLPETAQLLGGITVRHLHRLIERKELKTVPIGRRTLVHRDEIAAYIQRQQVTAAA